MEFSATKISCRQCGTTLTHDIAIPSSPTPYLHCTLQAPDDTEIVAIKNYISTVDNLLDVIDADLELLNVLAKRMAKVREEMQRILVNHRTILSPIRRLPNELLTKILWLSCPFIEDMKYSPSLEQKIAPFILSQVCSGWRNFIIGTPKLWSQIRIDGSEGPWSQPLVEEWILRSGDHPLSIQISNLKLNEAQELLCVTPILRALVAESRRWKRASVVLSQSMVLANLSSIKGRLPLLESLYINVTFCEVSMRPIDLLENTPNLRRIELGSRVWLEASPSTFHQLTHLKLGAVHVSVTDCLEILQLSPNLVELGMVCKPWFGEKATLSHPMPMIHLKHLKEMTFHVPHSNPSALFNHLDAPSLRQFSIFYYLRREWSSNAHTAFISFLHRSSQSLTSLNIFAFTTKGEEEIYGPCLLEYLRILPSLTTLRLEGSTSAWVTDQVIEDLTIRSHPPTLLPMLEDLTIHWLTLGPYLFADMIGSRWNLVDTDSCRKLKAVTLGLLKPTCGPELRQAWADCFDSYRDQGIRIFVDISTTQRDEIVGRRRVAD